MRRTPLAMAAVLALGLGTVAAGVVPSPEIGQPAPAFRLPDTRGTQHSLAQYRGRWVVLEWSNYGCPYVQKHYNSGNIPRQQQKWRDRGVVWLAVMSSAPGEQGHFAPAAMNTESERMGSNASAVLLDPAGTVGRTYDARTTPHMFVINPQGTLVYMGGIDNVATPRQEDLARARQLVDAALEEATAGRPVTTPTSRPYGCNVKYR
jgi:peroxiredoxin